MSDYVGFIVQRDPTLWLDKNAVESNQMTRGQAIRDLIFGVILPTIDVGSDLLFAFKLLLAEWSACPTMENNRFMFASVSFIFPTLSFLFATYHWWQLEKPNNRLKTLPFLLLQVWPQFRVMRLIYAGYIKKDSKWVEEQTETQETILCMEPFIESVPQVLWLTYLWDETKCVGPTVGPKGEIDPLGLVTYVTSILSASYGLTNFLRVGPLKIIPEKPVSGYGHLSFYLIIFGNASSLILRGLIKLAFQAIPGGPITHLLAGNMLISPFFFLNYSWLLSQYVLQQGSVYLTPSNLVLNTLHSS